MNASSFSGAARTVGVVLILLIAAAAGLAVGNLIQTISGGRSITADATFSREALDDLRALRTDEPASGDAYADYGIRHASVAPAYPDFGVRHPTIVATQVSDTFRLTGPSDVEQTVLRRQPAAN